MNGEWSWIYVAIDVDSRLVLDAAVFGRRGTNLAAAFLHKLTEKHDLSGTVFLVDGYSYLPALFRLGLSDQLDYGNRNLIEKWFHIFKIRIDCFPNSWVGS